MTEAVDWVVDAEEGWVKRSVELISSVASHVGRGVRPLGTDSGMD